MTDKNKIEKLKMELRASEALVDSYMRACRCVERKGECCKNCIETEEGWSLAIERQRQPHD